VCRAVDRRRYGQLETIREEEQRLCNYFHENLGDWYVFQCLSCRGYHRIRPDLRYIMSPIAGAHYKLWGHKTRPYHTYIEELTASEVGSTFSAWIPNIAADEPLHVLYDMTPDHFLAYYGASHETSARTVPTRKG
jgi:hypothetical protein